MEWIYPVFTPPGLRPQAANVYFIPENILYLLFSAHIVKLRQGSGKDRQGMAVKAKGLKA